jgi:hypothetical protein
MSSPTDPTAGEVARQPSKRPSLAGAEVAGQDKDPSICRINTHEKGLARLRAEPVSAGAFKIDRPARPFLPVVFGHLGAQVSAQLPIARYA